MSKYRVWVDLTATVPWDVEAESKDAAEKQVQEMWEDQGQEARNMAWEAHRRLESGSWVFGDAELLGESPSGD